MTPPVPPATPADAEGEAWREAYEAWRAKPSAPYQHAAGGRLGTSRQAAFRAGYLAALGEGKTDG